MASTYLNDLRIEEQATGENSGTWGTKLNSSLSQISEAFGYGTKQLSADADQTFTMPDGTSDGTRAIYLKITSAGSLTATRVVTLGPNTVSKLWIIENATTGSQSISIKQGSGATVTIPNGQNKVLYTDGAGSGAAVVDAFTDLSVPSLYVSGNIDVDGTANLDVVDIDGAVDMASTLTVAGDLAVDTDTLFVDASTDRVGIGLTAPSNVLHIKDSNPTIRIEDSDGSGAGIAQIQNTANGNLRLIADPNNDGSSASTIEFEIDGSEIARFSSSGRLGIGTTSPNQLLDVEGTTDPSIRVASTGTASGDDAIMRIQIGGTSASSYLYFGDSGDGDVGNIRYAHSNDHMIFTTAASEALRIDHDGFVGIGDNDPIDRLTVSRLGASWDGVAPNAITGALIHPGVSNSSSPSSGTALTIAGNSTASSTIYFSSNTDNDVGEIKYDHDNDSMAFRVNGSERMRITAGGRLAIGATTAGYELDVKGTTDPAIRVASTGTASTDDAIVRIQVGGSTAKSLLYFGDTDSSSTGRLRYDHSDDSLEIFTNGSEAIHITSAQKVGIGTSSPAYKLDVAGSINVTDTSGALAATFTTPFDYIAKFESTDASGYIVLEDSDSTSNANRIGVVGDSLRIVTNSTEAMHITSAQDIGLGGTPAAGYRLDVMDSGATLARLRSTADSDVSQYFYSAGTTAIHSLFFGDTSNSAAGSIRYYHSDDKLIFNGKGDGSEMARFDSSGRLGIGTTAPAYTLDVDSTIHVGNDGGSGFTHARTILDSNGAARGIGTFFHNQVNDVEWFAGNPYNDTDSWSINRQATASHADSTSNVTNALMSVDSAGNVLIGGTSTPSSSVGNLALFNGTAPSGSVTDGIVLYAQDVSSSSELKVRDEAGNVTTLSPHNFELIPEGPSEEMAWSYFSERDGKRINVDMLKAIRVLEKLSGEKLVFEN